MSSGPAAERCEICGQSNPSTLEEHHVVPRRFGGSDHPENLAKLCGGCHNAIERIYDDSFYERLQGLHREVQFEDSDTSGATAKPWEIDSREFLEQAKHVEFTSMSPERQFELDVLDDEVVNVVTVADQIKRLQRRIKTLEEEREQSEPELEQEFEVEAEEEFETELEESVEPALATEPFAGPPRESGTQSAGREPTIDEKIESCQQSVENIREDFEEDDVFDIESEYTQVISCGYCNRIFAKYEPGAAARHLQLAHHIDDPYEIAEEIEINVHAEPF